MAVTANKTVTVPTVKGGEITVEIPEKVRKGAPKDETKAAKWKRLVNFRGAKAVKLLRQIGNLSSSISYEYTADDAAKLVAAMQREVDTLKQRFTTKVQHDAPASIV